MSNKNNAENSFDLIAEMLKITYPVFKEISDLSREMEISEDDVREIFRAIIDETKEGVFDFIKNYFRPGGQGDGVAVNKALYVAEEISEAFGIKCPREVSHDSMTGEIEIQLNGNELSMAISKRFADRIVANKASLLSVLRKYPTLKPKDFICSGRHVGEMCMDVASIMNCNYIDSFNLCILLTSSRQ